MEIEKHQPGMFSWADLATTDREGSTRFYTQLLELEHADVPVGVGAFYTVLNKGGKSCAAIYDMPPEMREMTGGHPAWKAYFTVESADAAAARASELGGVVLQGPFDVFEEGRMVLIQDPTGAVFAVWEPKRGIGAQLFGEPGALAWCELYTRDTDRASDFYAGLFGWSAAPGPAADGLSEYIVQMIEDQPAAGMMAIREEWGEMPANWTIYLAVADLDESREEGDGDNGGRSSGFATGRDITPPMEVEDARSRPVRLPAGPWELWRGGVISVARQ